MYIFYNANPINNFTHDCTIRAISTVLGQSWDETFDGVAAVAKEMKTMPSVNRAWGRYLKRKGYVPYFIPDTCPNCYTVRDFCIDHPIGSYILGLDEHVIAVIDGNYYDTWDSGGELPFYYWQKEY